MDDPRLHQILTELLVEPDGGASLPERLCSACVDRLQVSAAALTLVTVPGEHLVVAATDAWARGLDELEFTLGEGPGLDAARDSGPVLVPDLRDQGRTARWPTYRPAALAAPLRAQFCLPLQIGAIRLGVLTLYRATPGGLSEADLAEAMTYADAATVLLLHLQDITDPDALHRDLGREFDLSAELHQATGMVSVQAKVSMAEALLLLRGRAFSANRSSADVARDVLQGTINFRPKGGHDE